MLQLAINFSVSILMTCMLFGSYYETPDNYVMYNCIAYRELLPLVTLCQAVFCFLILLQRLPYYVGVCLYVLSCITQVIQIVLFVVITPIWMDNPPDMVTFIQMIINTIGYLYIVSRKCMARKQNYQLVGQTNEECSICCISMDVGNIMKLPCEHIFHETCILTWCVTNRSCPLCRSYI